MLTVRVSSGSGARLAEGQLSFVKVRPAPNRISGDPGAPQQANRWRVISNRTHPTVPTSPGTVSVILNTQRPFTGLPLKADRGEPGMNVFVNGAMPAPIGNTAESSKPVGEPAQSFVPAPKLAPAPPRLLARVTGVPSGLISVSLRSASRV